jgi:eukaryotic-like serine/threonine-protein kinase
MELAQHHVTAEPATPFAALRSGFTTLSTRLEVGPVHARDGVVMAHRLCATLAAYHQAGATHGGVRPELVILPTGREWSQAVLARSAPGRELDAWSAPERHGGQPPSPQSDVYELCATVYTALAGRPPFQAEGARELAWLACHAPPPPLGVVRFELASERRLEALLTQGLSKDPRNRLSLAALTAELRRLAERDDVGEDLPTQPAAVLQSPNPNASSGSRPILTGVALTRALHRIAAEEALASRRQRLAQLRAAAVAAAVTALTASGLWLLIH